MDVLLDKYLSPTVRHNIEVMYYEKISRQAELNQVMVNPVFSDHPLKHISFNLDHGVGHVRDVATRVVKLLDDLNGVHFPSRSVARLNFMKGYGVMLAYVQDMGLLEIKSIIDTDHYGLLSARAVFNDFFDSQLAILWEENSGNVAWRITQLAFKQAITQSPHAVFREILALAGAHCATAISVDKLNHPAELRRAMQEMVGGDLSGNELASFLAIYYDNWEIFKQDSFSWLVGDYTETRELVDDIIDAIRVLRSANAGRVRGERLRATGGYQIFLNNQTAKAIYAINFNEQLFLMESTDAVLAGEVNLSSVEFTKMGDLYLSFYSGNFSLNKEISHQAVFNLALAIDVIQQEMIGVFARPPAGDNNSGSDYIKKWKPVYIYLENTEDNIHFATQVKDELILLNPALKSIIKVAPSLKYATEAARERYLSANDLDWNLKNKIELLEKISYSGHKIVDINPQLAFNYVKLAEIKTGEVLVQGGALACFVYIPLSEGLMGYPLGGYKSFHAHEFIPVGNVGIIRGDTRNATLIAEKTLKVLIIPREIYLNYWHSVYTESEFIDIIKKIRIKVKV